MKLLRLILFLAVMSSLPAMMLAGGPKADMLKFYDEVTGRDTVLQKAFLTLRYLYTDSLQVGYCAYDDDGQPKRDEIHWVTQDKIDFFRYDNHLYAPLTVMTDSTPSATYFMRHYRDRKSLVKIYTMGHGRHRQFYALYPDSTVQMIPDMVEFRDQERLERTGNHNFIRGFHCGPLVGMMGNGPVSIDDYPVSEAQQAVAAGLWMDWPFLRHGTSLHVKALYHALSAQTQRRGVAWSYNRRGIDLPVTLRYTSLHVPFRVIPFIEGGLNCRLALHNRLVGWSNLYEPRPGGDSYPSGELVRMEQNTTAMALSPMLGGGLRYRISDTRHAMLTFNYYLHTVMSDYGYGVHSTAMYYIREVSVNSWTLTLAVGLW